MKLILAVGLMLFMCAGALRAQDPSAAPAAGDVAPVDTASSSASAAEAPIPLPVDCRFLVGVNYPWHQENGMHWFGNFFGAMTDAHRAQVTENFRAMSRAGFHLVRFWVLAGCQRRALPSLRWRPTRTTRGTRRRQ